MTVEIDFSFPHKFECEALTELPGGGAPRLRFFPGDRVSGQDGVIVRIVPEAGEEWIGTFAFGRFGPRGVSRILSMPDADRVCIVARGAGYVVSSSHPDKWEEVKSIPIIDVRPVPSAGVLVFANFTEMVAYDERGLKWRTKRLAWDGLKVIAVGDRTLVGEYWDMRSEATERFEVDLLTGANRGGVEV